MDDASPPDDPPPDDASPRPDPSRRLLGVDLGLRTGFALWGPTPDGPVRLQAYGSSHLGNRQALRRAAPGILDRFAPLDLVVVEGDAALGRIWERAAAFRGAAVVGVHAERWRAALLLDRQQRSGRDAKRHADARAEQVVAWSRADGAAAPATTGALRSDTAEAILIGLWGALARGLLDRSEVPWPLP